MCQIRPIVRTPILFDMLLDILSIDRFDLAQHLCEVVDPLVVRQHGGIVVYHENHGGALRPPLAPGVVVILDLDGAGREVLVVDIGVDVRSVCVTFRLDGLQRQLRWF